MNDALTARPHLLKQANLSRIRRAIKIRGSATRAEIASDTKISPTTIRSLLSEMIQNSEIESMGYDESSGGRKATRYRLNSERYHSVAFCITDNQIHGLLVNVCGEILEITLLKPHLKEDDYEPAITAFLDKIITQKEIRSVGIGVPGIVDGSCYWRKNNTNGELYRNNLGERLSQKYNIPVILENDINATAIGFGRCYAKNFSNESLEHTNMSYLYFEKGCVSAGFIAGGKIIRGFQNFAGEIGLVPLENGKLLDECLSSSPDEAKHISLITNIICWICGILNPEYIALGGPDLNKDYIAPISDEIFSLLPQHMLPQILYVPDVWHDYHDGMAYLTAAKMFDEVHLIKE